MSYTSIQIKGFSDCIAGGWEENAFVYLEEDKERSKSNFSSSKRTMSRGWREKSTVTWG